MTCLDSGPVGRRERASELYREHHRTSRSPEFVFGGGERIELFRGYVGGPGRRVLDLGCRYGALTRAYSMGNEVVGVDVDKVALEEAARVGIETVWADVEEPLPFQDEAFDVVVAGELLEHLREPYRVVGEVDRVLRSDGAFVGSVPNAFRLKNRLRFLIGQQPEKDPDPSPPLRSRRCSTAPRGLRQCRASFHRKSLPESESPAVRERHRLLRTKAHIGVVVRSRRDARPPQLRALAARPKPMNHTRVTRLVA